MQQITGRVVGVLDTRTWFDKVNLFKIAKVKRDGFDRGGNYWGREYSDVYCCIVHVGSENKTSLYVAANSREEAKRHISAVVGSVAFYI